MALRIDPGDFSGVYRDRGAAFRAKGDLARAAADEAEAKRRGWRRLRRMSDRLRIFVSSAGDAAAERQRARLVIEKLATSYARSVTIEPILFEVKRMLAAAGAQGDVDLPGRDDIVVLILSPPPATALPETAAECEVRDGENAVPPSGTESAIEDLLAGQKRPLDLLAYRRRAQGGAPRDDEAERAAANPQWDSLARFWSRSLIDVGAIGAADMRDFADPDAFAAKLEGDLRTLIKARVARAPIEHAITTGAVIGAGLGFALAVRFGSLDLLVDPLIALPCGFLGAGIGWLAAKSGVFGPPNPPA